jgi:hypothetical protein
MRRAARMHVNRRTWLCESPCGAGVIEMNVTQENVTHVFGREAGFAKIDNHIVERRFRSGIEQRDSVVGLERGRGHNSGVPKLSCI